MCTLVDMEYIASDELGNLVRLGIVREVNFTYAGPVSSNQHITVLLNNPQRTVDDVCDSWAMVVCGDGRADDKLSHSCY